jgi:hypothetical protein
MTAEHASRAAAGGVSWKTLAGVAGGVLSFLAAAWANTVAEDVDRTRAGLAAQAERVAVVEAQGRGIERAVEELKRDVGAKLTRIEDKFDRAFPVANGGTK